jgi:small subunit ribosomal protein S20e
VFTEVYFGMNVFVVYLYECFCGFFNSKTNKVCSDLVNRCKASALHTKGPVRMPTKVLKITTRKTPNGEGSKTWDSYEMRIHKRLIDIQSTGEMVKKITAYNMEAGVNIEITVAQ